MAIKPANSNYHTFTFNGVRAADYGIYVTDVNVFNSAARDVEYIQIPGRDGAFALDRGRFQNISVVYKCAMTQDTDEDFATAISEFRNAIASTKGYKRLEDDIHTDEYRMGVFSKGLEAPTLNTKTATFDVEFNCQPQRFLKSGETAVSVSSGGQITNPTLFESHPLLQVWGYGDININDETVTIDDVLIGNVILSNGSTSIPYVDFSEANLRTGDTITLNQSSVFSVSSVSDGSITGLNISRITGDQSIIENASVMKNSEQEYRLYIFFNNIAFASGTGNTKIAGIEIGFNYTQGGETVSQVVAYNIEVTYSTNGRIRIRERLEPSVLVPDLENSVRYTIGAVTAYSTKFALGEPLYFDLDTGEAYKIEDGTIISVNNAVSFPAQLPVLKSGANTITYDDTVDQFKVVPRWWEV